MSTSVSGCQKWRDKSHSEGQKSLGSSKVTVNVHFRVAGSVGLPSDPQKRGRDEVHADVLQHPQLPSVAVSQRFRDVTIRTPFRERSGTRQRDAATATGMRCENAPVRESRPVLLHEESPRTKVLKKISCSLFARQREQRSSLLRTFVPAFLPAAERARRLMLEKWYLTSEFTCPPKTSLYNSWKANSVEQNSLCNS